MDVRIIAELTAFRDHLRSYVHAIRDEWKTVVPKNVQCKDHAWDLLVMLKCCQGVSDANVLSYFKKKFDDGFWSTPEMWVERPMIELVDFLKPTSCQVNNAGQLKYIAEILMRDYNGKVPHDLYNLMLLHGIGRKTAILLMDIMKWLGEAGLLPGIPFDRHVTSSSVTLDFADGHTPDECAHQVELWLPRCHWTGFNELFAGTYQLLQKKETRDIVIREARVMSSRLPTVVATIERLDSAANKKAPEEEEKATAKT